MRNWPNLSNLGWKQSNGLRPPPSGGLRRATEPKDVDSGAALSWRPSLMVLPQYVPSQLVVSEALSKDPNDWWVSHVTAFCPQMKKLSHPPLEGGHFSMAAIHTSTEESLMKKKKKTSYHLWTGVCCSLVLWQGIIWCSTKGTVEWWSSRKVGTNKARNRTPCFLMAAIYINIFNYMTRQPCICPLCGVGFALMQQGSKVKVQTLDKRPCIWHYSCTAGYTKPSKNWKPPSYLAISRKMRVWLQDVVALGVDRYLLHTDLLSHWNWAQDWVPTLPAQHNAPSHKVARWSL